MFIILKEGVEAPAFAVGKQRTYEIYQVLKNMACIRMYDWDYNVKVRCCYYD